MTDVENICKNGTRFVFLDIAKGIGIILVLMAHSVGFPIGGRFLTAYYMPLFFLVSGYSYKRCRNVLPLILKKIRGLLLPYFIYNLILIVLCYKEKIIFLKQDILISLLGILYSRYCFYYPLGKEHNIYMFLIHNEALWFLTCIFVSSLLFLLIVEKCLENNKFFIFTIFLFLIISSVLNKLPILLPWSVDTAFLGTLFMLVGASISKYSVLQKINCSNKKKYLIAFYLILCYSNGSINMSVRNYGDYGSFSVILFFIIGILGSLILTFICLKLERLKWSIVLSIIGKNTIVILALHNYIFYKIDNYFINTKDMFNKFIYGYTKVVVAIAICMLLSKIFSHIKALFIKF